MSLLMLLERGVQCGTGGLHFGDDFLLSELRLGLQLSQFALDSLRLALRLSPMKWDAGDQTTFQHEWQLTGEHRIDIPQTELVHVHEVDLDSQKR